MIATMNWQEIERITGHTIIYATVVGSTQFNLRDINSSDTDYAVFVKPNKNSKYDPNEAYKLIDAGNADLFFGDINLFKSIDYCGSLHAMQTYRDPVYALNGIGKFLNENHTALANISPRDTYVSYIGLLNAHLKLGTPRVMARSVRDAGILYNFMELHDMESSFNIKTQFRDLYRVLHVNPTVFNSSDVKAMLYFLETDHVHEYFENYPSDMELFEKFQKCLSEYI